METQIYVKSEVDDLDTNHCDTQTFLKREQTETNEDEVNTPLRDETIQTDEPVEDNIGDHNWESDNEEAIPPPPTIGPVTMITARTDSIKRESKVNSTEPDQDCLDIPEDYFNALLDAPLIKEEECRRIPLDFLDSITDSDLEASTNQNHFSNHNELNTMDLEPPPESVPNTFAASTNQNNFSNQNELNTVDMEPLPECVANTFAASTNQNNFSNQNELNTMDLEPPPKSVPNTFAEVQLETEISKRNKTLKKHKKRHRSCSSSPNPRKAARILEKVNGSGRASPSINPANVKPDQLNSVPLRKTESMVRLTNIKNLLVPGLTTDANPVLSIQEKRQLAMKRAKAVLEKYNKQSLKENEDEFLIVNTIRKLPSTTKFMSCDIFEYPSPLCNNFNVSYKFNSTTPSNVVLEKWGLTALPLETAKLLRLTGIDALRLDELQQNSKMQLQKLRKQEAANKATNQVKFESSTSLYKSVSVQTDGHLSLHTRDAAVQVLPKFHYYTYWQDALFDEDNLPQQQTSALLMLKEICATKPSSIIWADRICKALATVLEIKRAETAEINKS